MKRTHTNRFWVLLLTAAFAVCAATALLSFRSAETRTVARVAVDGGVVREIDLSAVTVPYSFDVQTPKGVNTVSVRPGAICVSHADCPDQVCVARGWLEGGRVPVVCLPHRLVISLTAGGNEEAFDAVAG